MQTGSRALIVFDNGFVRRFPLDTPGGKQRLTIGRQSTDASPDLAVASRFVSKAHGLLTLWEGRWYYENLPDNLCGTWYNGEPLGKAAEGGGNGPRALKNGDYLIIRSDRGGGKVVFLYLENSPDRVWVRRILSRYGDRVFVGSNPDYCSICLPLPGISARNTAFEKNQKGYVIEDLGSLRGTYLNGRRLTDRVQLRDGDMIGIDRCLLVYMEGDLYYGDVQRNDPARNGLDLAGRPTILKAEIQSKSVKDKSSRNFLESVTNLFVPRRKELLRKVSLEIREGTLVALLGTAGAGKTTVMNCLNGMELEGVQGRIFFGDVDLCRDFSAVQNQIGSVPQQKVVHPSLTVTEELTEAAIMRLPAGTSRREIADRVENTINVLGLQNVKNSKVVKLSGGEMGRVNVGIELVADRRLLCLDEPDAGLSPNLKKELFLLLQDLAHKQNVTILAIIHDVSEIYMFDQIIMMVKADNVGRLAFSGTPEAARKYFGTEIKNIYEILEADPGRYVRE